ncbi:unnamed protein product, partial [Rotaria sp. Silwood1]
VKPENILIKGEHVKLADFGMCRSISSERPLTDYIATRWYRAPECILTKGYYEQSVDIWSTGCVMFEILTLKPLFVGKTELDLINKIHTVLGTPSMEMLKKFEQHRNHQINFNFPPQKGIGFCQYLTVCSIDTLDLLIQMLIYDPQNRISASNALKHPYFDHLRTIEVDTKHVLSIRDIPIVETNNDDFVPEQLSTVEKESSASNLSEGKKNLSIEVFWEKLSGNALYYFNVIERLFTLAQKIDIYQNMTFMCGKSISNQVWLTFVFVQINMKKIQMNLESMLTYIKTMLNILVKAPTWKLTTQLLTSVLRNLKRNGENCLILINELQNKCDNVTKQINEIIPIVADHLLNANAKTTEFHVRHSIEVVSSFIWTIIGIMTHNLQVIQLNEVAAQQQH